MIIFLFIFTLILIALFIKIKVRIFFTLNNLEYYYRIDIRYIKNIKTIVAGDKKSDNKKLKKNIFKVINKIKIEKLSLYLNLGLLEILPTVYGVTIASIIISVLYGVLSKNFICKDKREYEYRINPSYNKLILSGKLIAELSIRPIDLAIILLK